MTTPAVYNGGGGGGGGKMRKPISRRTPATPYDRPRGWISRIVGGATRMIPSLFSRSVSNSTQELEYNNPEEEESADEEKKDCFSNLGHSESAAEGTNPCEEVEILNNSSNADQLNRDDKTNLPSGNDFAKIEQLVKENQFSSDYVNRLLESLHSNVVEASNMSPVGKEPKSPVRRESEGPVLAHETPRLLFKEKQESMNVAGLRTPMPLFQSSIKEEVGASPIDIARAYMENRISEVSTDYKGAMSKHVGDLVRSDRYSSKSLVSSPSPKTSLCWPGAVVEERFGHSTPQSVSSSRYGLHQFQRSPYSRSIYSKSKSKLARPEAENTRFQNFPSSTRRQPQTPILGQSEYMHNERSGSAGPIRRMRRKFLSEASPRGSTSYLSSQNGHSPTVFTDTFLPTTKNLDSTVSKASTRNGFEAGVPALQPYNSKIRAIMDHLDRQPTPKESMAELQLATSSDKDSLYSKLTDTLLKEGTDRSKSSFEERPRRRSEGTDVEKDTKTGTTVNGNYGYQRKSSNETFSFGLSNNKLKSTEKPSTSGSENERPSITNTSLNSTIMESLKRPPHHPSGPKPNLASISVDKPPLGQTFFSNSNYPGFTFPVSSRSNALPEPPTPSIMPSSTAGSPSQLKSNENEIPKFNFGEKRTTPGLKFSFPSTSNGSVQGEVSDLKFSFGAGKKARLSFKSAGGVGSC